MKKISIVLSVFIAFFCLSAGVMYATHSIDHLKNQILETVCRKNPQYIPMFKDFFARYDTVVTRFFDTHNNQSLMQEIKAMEVELDVLKKTSHDTRFSCVKNLLYSLYSDLDSMIITLKKYVNSSNYVSFALSLRRYKSLLPDPIVNKGDFCLFLSLKHRLTC